HTPDRPASSDCAYADLPERVPPRTRTRPGGSVGASMAPSSGASRRRGWAARRAWTSWSPGSVLARVAAVRVTLRQQATVTEEAGANPARSRHCHRGAILTAVTVVTTGRPRGALIREPGDSARRPSDPGRGPRVRTSP